MHYRFTCPKPNNRYLEIELIIDDINEDELTLHLPSWRPGRYETGNFAKNIQRIAAFNESDQPVALQKINKDTWLASTRNSSKLILRYNYYAVQPDAGGCYISDDLIYINPVHCCIYADDRLHQPCSVSLPLPEKWQIASGMIRSDEGLLIAADYHELVDSPLMASPALLHKSYSLQGITFHIWMNGVCNPDWERIVNDFQNFTAVQLSMMNSFPSKAYHFLVLLLPYKFYHGVEHTTSTVLALGPGYALMNDELYNEFIGVASHELFHAWNIKTIRPVEMLPYRYQQENYSRSGWVYEGFTTYYGDLFLARSGFFNAEQYLTELSTRLQKHMDNYGRFNYSVAASSFDTWLDGYVPGIPARKTSIYDEGCLVAFILDLFIRRHSNWQFSLDDVMRALYTDFALQSRGYSERDIKMLAEHFAGHEADQVFNEIINAPASYLDLLSDLLADVGCEVRHDHAKNIYEHLYGFRIVNDATGSRVLAVAPESPAEKAGLSKDDELICLDDLKIENNLNELISLNGKNHVLEVFSMKRKKSILLKAGKERFFGIYSIVHEKKHSVAGKHFKSWTGIS